MTAQALIKSGRFEQAEELLKNEISKNPKDEAKRKELTWLHERWAKSCYERTDFEGALKQLKLCLEGSGLTEWSVFRMRLLIAHLQRRLDRRDLAMEEIERLEAAYHGTDDLYFKNLILNEREITEGKTILKSYPSRMTVRLTNRCQIRCTMCVMPNEKAWYAPKNIMDEVAELTPYLEDLQWQGGEVFVLNRNFFRGLLERGAANPHLGQSIITNGLLIDPQWAEVLVRCGIHIRISIDGATKEVYETIRAGSKWEDLLSSIENMNEEMDRQGKRNIPLELHMVVMRSNYRQIEEMVEFGRQYRFGMVDLSPLIVGGTSAEEDIFNNGTRETWEELQAQRARAKEKARRYGIQVSDNLPFPPKEFTDAAREPLQATKDVRDSLPQWKPIDPLFCLSAWKKMIVRDGGSLITNWHCDHDIGHVDRHSLMDAWNGEQMQLYRKRITERNQQNLCTSFCLSGALTDAWRDQIEWNWS